MIIVMIIKFEFEDVQMMVRIVEFDNACQEVYRPEGSPGENVRVMIIKFEFEDVQMVRIVEFDNACQEVHRPEGSPGGPL